MICFIKFTFNLSLHDLLSAMSNLTDVPVVKCVIVGDDEAGKTSMMRKYAEISGLPFSNEHKEIVTAFNGQKCVFVQLSSDSEDENRPIYDAHVFLLCVSVARQSSVEETVKMIMDTVIENICDVPFVLIGTQIDKRLSTPIHNYREEDKGFLPMPLNQAESFAKTIGASKYLECSATTGEGLDEVFEDAFAVGQSFALEQKRGLKRNLSSFEDAKERKPSCITQ